MKMRPEIVLNKPFGRHSYGNRKRHNFRWQWYSLWRKSESENHIDDSIAQNETLSQLV